MKLSIEGKVWMIDNKTVELRFFYTDEMKIMELKEVLDKEFCQDKRLIKRIIDKMFYELKEAVYKYYALSAY